MTASQAAVIPEHLRPAVEVLWDYHDMHHQLRPADVGIGLGSHDLSVATTAAELFHAGLFPLIVFTGANAPTTIERFPHGEAIHYREHAIELGVPESAILIEARATNTGENISFTRRLLAREGILPHSAMLISRPYQQRRAYATCRQLWPDLDVICASVSMTPEKYIASIGDAEKVINMLVGDTQRIDLYARQGLSIPQPMPTAVREAMHTLVAAGYTKRWLSD